MKKHLLIIGYLLSLYQLSFAQNASYLWDSIKNQTQPLVAPAFQSEYTTPHKQTLASYGWEDGLQISKDGLHLYALYSPSDLVSWNSFFTNHTQLPICDLLGNMNYMRPYANSYGMDFTTNGFGCDSFANIDILYAHRNTTSDNFSNWQLSGIARAGAIEGSPSPLFSETNANLLDLFMFTGNGDIWMISNTTANPNGINNAIRLPSPINPSTNEFSADNAFIERIHNDTIILVYEKYTDASVRTFMYCISNDLGQTWETPQAITTITNALGHIEHPCIYKDANSGWWLYFSIDYSSIVRAHQTIAGNWDSWGTPETIITKGNAVSIGEPTVTSNGDISFALGYINTPLGDTTDVYDLDPWILPHQTTTAIATVNANEKLLDINVYPVPFSEEITIEFNLPTSSEVSVELITLTGQQAAAFILHEARKAGANILKYSCNNLLPGTYICCVKTANQVIRKLIVKQ